MTVVGEAAEGAQAIALARLHAPDVVLMDVHLPGLDGVAVAAQISQTTRVVMLTSVVEPTTVVNAVAAGARGYLVHGQFDQWKLAEVIRGIADGLSYLSPPAAAALVDQWQQDRYPALRPEGSTTLTQREHEVMELIAGGLSNREIARRLVISEKTVKNHVHHIYQRLNAESRNHSVALWRGLAAR